jgi:hypothetical protein
MVFAQAAPVTDVFIQYGALGGVALLALLAVRVLYQRENIALDLERKRADRLEAELGKLNATVQERYVVTLTEATRAISEALDATRGRG